MKSHEIKCRIVNRNELKWYYHDKLSLQTKIITTSITNQINKNKETHNRIKRRQLNEKELKCIWSIFAAFDSSNNGYILIKDLKDALSIMKSKLNHNNNHKQIKSPLSIHTPSQSPSGITITSIPSPNYKPTMFLFNNDISNQLNKKSNEISNVSLSSYKHLPLAYNEMGKLIKLLSKSNRHDRGLSKITRMQFQSAIQELISISNISNIIDELEIFKDFLIEQYRYIKLNNIKKLDCQLDTNESIDQLKFKSYASIFRLHSSVHDFDNIMNEYDCNDIGHDFDYNDQYDRNNYKSDIHIPIIGISSYTTSKSTWLINEPITIDTIEQILDEIGIINTSGSRFQSNNKYNVLIYNCDHSHIIYKLHHILDDYNHYIFTVKSAKELQEHLIDRLFDFAIIDYDSPIFYNSNRLSNCINKDIPLLFNEIIKYRSNDNNTQVSKPIKSDSSISPNMKSDFKTIVSPKKANRSQFNKPSNLVMPSLYAKVNSNKTSSNDDVSTNLSIYSTNSQVNLLTNQTYETLKKIKLIDITIDSNSVIEDDSNMYDDINDNDMFYLFDSSDPLINKKKSLQLNQWKYKQIND